MPVPLTLNVYKGEALVLSKDYQRDIIKIGRLSSAHLCLDDEKVSRIHSVIEVGADGALSIIDMGSVEGTWVNGKRVNKGALTFGDEIRVGNTTIRLDAPAPKSVRGTNGANGHAPQMTDVAVDSNTWAIATGSTPQLGERVMVTPLAPVTPSPVVSQPPAVAPAPVAVAAPAQIPAAPEPLEPTPLPVRADAHGSPHDGGPQAASFGHRARRKKGAGPLGLELRFMWGDQMVGEFFLPPGDPRRFTVGTASGVDFTMGDARLGGKRFVVARADGQGFVLRFTGKMKGRYAHRDESMDLTQAIESHKATREGDAYAIPLGAEDFASIDLGGVTVEACLQSVPKAAVAPFSETIDFAWLNILLLLFFVASVFVVTAHSTVADADQYSDELNSNQARLAKLIVKPETRKQNAFLERLARQKEKAQGELAAKNRGDEGQAGKKDAPKKNQRMAPKGDPSNKDQARMITQKIFGGKSGGLSTIFGKSGLGGELKSAMGNMFGAAPGDSGGFGGLGLRGSGAGGGGVGDTIGIGAVGTKGRGGGTGKYGDGVGLGMGGKKGVDIGIAASDPEVTGSLDKELIRQVIRRNIGQIRYCYENQLTRHPRLAGKVSVRFVITAAGTVASSNVAQSTANNAELETCVAGRVRTWVFPKPKGGGVVIVTYPFVFKQSGE